MDIRIDGRPLTEVEAPGENLEEILGGMQERHLPDDRIIVEVRVNGQVYSEDVPHAAVELARAAIQSLELVTQSSEEIARHFLKNGPLFIQSMVEAIPKITEMFRVGDETEANEHYLRFLESLHLTVNMAQQVNQVLDIRRDQAIGDLGSFNDRMQKLADILGQIVKIQEQNDWIYLADLLEYELKPELEAIAEILPQLSSVDR